MIPFQELRCSVAGCKRPAGANIERLCRDHELRTLLHNAKRSIEQAAKVAAAPQPDETPMSRALEEMQRYLPVLERLEAEPVNWARITAGTGIATTNAYRFALKQALREE